MNNKINLNQYTIKILPREHTPTGEKAEDIEIPKMNYREFNRKRN